MTTEADTKVRLQPASQRASNAPLPRLHRQSEFIMGIQKPSPPPTTVNENKGLNGPPTQPARPSNERLPAPPSPPKK